MSGLLCITYDFLQAEAYVVQAEGNNTDSNIGTGFSYVNPLPEGKKKRELIARLEALIRPVITLTGGAVTIDEGIPYSDQGFSAEDNIDGYITANVVLNYGGLDINDPVAGVYTVRYNVSDSNLNAAIEKTRSVTVEAVADTTPPSVPTGLVASNITQTAFTGTWNASTGEPTGYEISINDGAAINTGTSLTHTKSDAVAGTTYTMKVRAYDAAGNRSAYSSNINITTTAANLNDPSNLTVTPVSTTSLQLEWDGNNVAGTEYQIFRKPDACTDFNYVLAATVTTESYLDTDLDPYRLYCYTVRSRNPNTAVVSDYSPRVSGTTPHPFAPPILSGVLVGDTVELDWVMPSTNTVSPDSFEMEVDINSTGFNIHNTYSNNVFSDTHSAFSPGDIVVYRIRAYSTLNAGPPYPWSNFVTINIPEAYARLTYVDYIQQAGVQAGRRIGVEVYWSGNSAAPWVVWSPGSGEDCTVSDATPINYNGLVGGEGLPKFIRNGGEKPYNIISIQMPQFQSNWDYQIIDEALDEVKVLFPELNINSVSGGGWSGGTGFAEWSVQYPGRTNVVFPMASWGFPTSQSSVNTWLAAGVCVWAFHASNDGTIAFNGNLKNQMVASPSYDANKHRFTRFTTGGHGIPDEIINGSGFASDSTSDYTPYPNTGGTYVTLDDFILANG